MKKKDPNKYPKGWDRKRVEAVLAHYDNQTEDEAVAEDEAAFTRGLVTVMEIPTEIVPKVLELISKYRKSQQSSSRSTKGRRSA